MNRDRIDMREFLDGLKNSYLKTRKRYVVKHNLIIEVYLMTMCWKQLHVSAYIGYNQVV